MKITMKRAKNCPCHDPIVFGHEQPCPQWSTHSNNRTRSRPLVDGQPYLMTDFQFGSIAMTETAQAIQRLRRTVDQFNALMREVDEATSSPPSHQNAGPA